MRAPHWPPRDWRAIIALTASILGAAALTDFFGMAGYGLLAIIGAILLSLGLAINRRSVRGSAFGASFEAAGGEDDDADSR